MSKVSAFRDNVEWLAGPCVNAASPLFDTLSHLREGTLRRRKTSNHRNISNKLYAFSLKLTNIT